ncbi:MAG: PorV/PorQ family protein [candidate division KSB1 bacterium]|nr:PorV/PorQ family protein [candidate division KSB1 bacterium]MDZ7345774.1 PorV/PorQ family protein [candidate division KSB1 bacterium]
MDKIKNRVGFAAALCLLFCGAAAAADVSKVGITAAPFLEIGAGARPLGMGGAFVATADDAGALYWNPAGLTAVRNIELLFTNSSWLANIKYNFAGICFPVAGVGSLGAFITTLNYGDMAVRTTDQPEGTGEIFSASDLAVGVSYARALTDRFTIGFNAKYIHQSIWHERAHGIAVDFGTLFVTGLHGLRIGASLLNFGTDMRMEGKDLLVFYDVDPYIIGNNDRVPANLQTEHWPLPLTFQFGLAMDVLDDGFHRLTLASDAVHPYDNTESVNLGAEYAFRKMFFLRAGMRDLFLRDGEGGASFGAGFHLRLLGNMNLRIDYAYANFGRLDNAQHLSLTLNL